MKTNAADECGEKKLSRFLCYEFRKSKNVTIIFRPELVFGQLCSFVAIPLSISNVDKKQGGRRTNVLENGRDTDKSVAFVK